MTLLQQVTSKQGLHSSAAASSGPAPAVRRGNQLKLSAIAPPAEPLVVERFDQSGGEFITRKQQ